MSQCESLKDRIILYQTKKLHFTWKWITFQLTLDYDEYFNSKE